MKIQTASLKTFISKASKIQRSTHLPVLSNLKVSITDGICLIIKSNLEATLIGQVEYEGEDQELLIDEQTLSAIAGSAKSEWIEIMQEGANIKILYGKSKVTLPTEPVENFPVMPDITEAEIYKFNSDQLLAINTASHFIGEAEAMSYVQVIPGHISAFSNHFFYINSSFDNMPTVLLRSDEISILPSNELEFSDLDRHHVFYQSGFTYIFTKVEGKPTDLTQVLNRLQLPGKEFTFDISELIAFCNDANNISQSQIATCTMSGSSLYLNDASYSRSIDAEYTCEGQPDEFTFNSRVSLAALKQLPTGIVKAKTNINCLIIHNETANNNEWFCFLGMSK